MVAIINWRKTGTMKERLIQVRQYEWKSMKGILYVDS